MPKNYFDLPEPQRLRDYVQYNGGNYQYGKTEYMNCMLAALRAKLKNPRGVKIHVSPFMGGVGIPHVYWEETQKNGKRVFRDFWHDEKLYNAGERGKQRALRAISDLTKKRDALLSPDKLNTAAGKEYTSLAAQLATASGRQKDRIQKKMTSLLVNGLDQKSRIRYEDMTTRLGLLEKAKRRAIDSKYENRLFGIKLPTSAPVLFKGKVRNRLGVDYMKAMLEEGETMSKKFLGPLAVLFSKSTDPRIRARQFRTGGIAAAIAAGYGADKAMDHVIRKDKTYKGYKGHAGKITGTALGAMAGIPLAVSVGSLPSFHNQFTRIMGRAPALLRRITSSGTFNNGAVMSKGKTRLLAAALGAAGMAVPVIGGRMIGSGADAAAKGINYGIHKARQRKSEKKAEVVHDGSMRPVAEGLARCMEVICHR